MQGVDDAGLYADLFDTDLEDVTDRLDTATRTAAHPLTYRRLKPVNRLTAQGRSSWRLTEWS